MRKQFKIKRRSCALCKPHKHGWASRWKPRERQSLLDAQNQAREAMNRRSDPA